MTIFVLIAPPPLLQLHLFCSRMGTSFGLTLTNGQSSTRPLHFLSFCAFPTEHLILTIAVDCALPNARAGNGEIPHDNCKTSDNTQMIGWA